MRSLHAFYPCTTAAAYRSGPALRDSILGGKILSSSIAAANEKPMHKIVGHRVYVSHDGASDLIQQSNSPAGVVLRRFMQVLLNKCIKTVAECKVPQYMNTYKYAVTRFLVREPVQPRGLVHDLPASVSVSVPCQPWILDPNVSAANTHLKRELVDVLTVCN